MYLVRCVWKVHYPVLALTLYLSGSGFASDLTPELELAYRIEWELLADPLTFPYAWNVQVSARGVELAGIVPGDDVRERALHLASRVTNVPIQDRILIQAMPRPAKLPPRSPRELGEAVRQRLEQIDLAGASRALEIDIYPDASGIVTLRGWVPSLQDKLLASRCLRDLEQCLAVRNFLEVRPPSNLIMERSDRSSQWASEQNQHPDPFLWRPLPIQPNARTYVSSTRTAPYSQRLLAPPIYPSMRYIVTSGSNNQQPVDLSASQRFTSHVISLPNIQPDYRQAAMQTVRPTLAGSYVRMPIPVVNTPTGQPLAGNSLTDSPTRTLTIASPTLNATTVTTAPTFTGQPIQISLPSSNQAKLNYQAMPKFMPNDPVSTNRSVIRVANDPNIAEPAAGGGAVRDYPAQPSLPTLTVNTSPGENRAASFVQSAIAQPARLANPNPDVRMSNAQLLRNRLLSALGPNIQDVQISEAGGKSLRLKLRVPSVEAIDKIAPTLFQLPDLEGYDVKVEFEVAGPLPR